jgi:hypothetical protein
VNIQSKTLSFHTEHACTCYTNQLGDTLPQGTHGGFPRSTVTPSLASSQPSANKPMAGTSSTGMLRFAGLDIWTSRCRMSRQREGRVHPLGSFPESTGVNARFCPIPEAFLIGCMKYHDGRDSFPAISCVSTERSLLCSKLNSNCPIRGSPIRASSFAQCTPHPGSPSRFVPRCQTIRRRYIAPHLTGSSLRPGP